MLNSLSTIVEWLASNISSFQGLQLLCEAPSVDEKATKEFPARIQKLTEDDYYTLNQIYNFDEADLYCTCTLQRAYI